MKSLFFVKKILKNIDFLKSKIYNTNKNKTLKNKIEQNKYN